MRGLKYAANSVVRKLPAMCFAVSLVLLVLSRALRLFYERKEGYVEERDGVRALTQKVAESLSDKREGESHVEQVIFAIRTIFQWPS